MRAIEEVKRAASIYVNCPARPDYAGCSHVKLFRDALRRKEDNGDVLLEL